MSDDFTETMPNRHERVSGVHSHRLVSHADPGRSVDWSGRRTERLLRLALLLAMLVGSVMGLAGLLILSQ